MLKFFVAILGGLAHLKDLSYAAHLLDKDRALAQARGETGRADHSGVSRTLTALMQAEAEHLGAALTLVRQLEQRLKQFE